MISLARANLIHDWRRHATAVVVLVLAGLLMTTQLGFVAGFAESQGELQRQLRADIIVKKKPRAASQGGFFRRGSRGIDTRLLGQIWMHPEIEDVQGYSPNQGSARWELDDGTTEFVRVQIIDSAEGSMTYPRRFPDSLREILATPGMVVMTRATARKLQLDLGATGTVSGNTLTVGGIVDGLSGGFIERIFVSAQTARMINAAGNSRSVENYLVRLENAAMTDQVIAELNEMLTPAGLEAIRPDEFASAQGLQELLTSTFGWILMGSAIFGLVVGCGVASQTLRGAFLAQLKEFGALRALGVSRGRMAAVAMEQAWWTGIASIPVMIIIAHGVRALAGSFDLNIALPNSLMIGTSLLLVIVAIVAGTIALTAVMRVEPAELLR